MYPYKKIKLSNGKTIDEHRLVMEKHLCRKLKRNEWVHHINGNKKDNRIENLKIISPSEHTKKHHKEGNLYKFKLNDLIKGAKTKSKNIRKKRKIKEGYLCNFCKKVKSIEAFHKDKYNWSGLKTYCKECIKIKQKKHKVFKL